MKLYQILFIVALFTVSACKKKDATPDKTTLLTQKEWIVTAERSQGNGTPWKDEFSDNLPCHKDDRIKFDKNGTYDVLEGPTKCYSYDPDFVSENETWSFKENETKITLSGNGGYELKILQLDEDTFKILHEYGDNNKEETTLRHP